MLRLAREIEDFLKFWYINTYVSIHFLILWKYKNILIKPTPSCHDGVNFRLASLGGEYPLYPRSLSIMAVRVALVKAHSRHGLAISIRASRRSFRRLYCDNKYFLEMCLTLKMLLGFWWFLGPYSKYGWNSIKGMQFTVWRWGGEGLLCEGHYTILRIV